MIQRCAQLQRTCFMRANPTPLTRRRMLQTTTGALLAGAVSHAPAAAKKSVIVIGGLSCAYDLVERGHDVTLLEASRCIGGHVKTIYDSLPDGQYADVGAEQFISSPATAARSSETTRAGLRPAARCGRSRASRRHRLPRCRLQGRSCRRRQVAGAGSAGLRRR